MKWKSLVDMFRTKDQIRSGAPGTPQAEKAQEWKFYQQMSFIRPYIYSRLYVIIIVYYTIQNKYITMLFK